MSSKKWCGMFLCLTLFFVLLIAGMNILIDPFGIFGDYLMDWHSYGFTKNPRIAKFGYLDSHYKEYDSYIVGSSTASAYTADRLNQYTGDSFYNAFMYGCDMYVVNKTVSYIIENYNVKNIVMPIGLMDTLQYNAERNTLTDRLHEKAESSSRIAHAEFYLKYMFANPKYMTEKVGEYSNAGFLPTPSDVFDIKTGSYNKAGRDVEPIGGLETYFKNYPAFDNYRYTPQIMSCTDECLQSIAEIKKMCERNGVSLTVIFSTEYYLMKDYYSIDEMKDFWLRLAEITDFWDFCFNSVSTDARYFYDVTHVRNALGDMALGRIFGDESIYIPKDFGFYVTSENAAEYVRTLEEDIPLMENNTKSVPILMYHHFAEEGNDYTLTPENFEAHIKALTEAGYTGISVEQLNAYVHKGEELPEHPVLITMDDGYYSNYEFAYPILQKYNMKADIFVIGSSVGKDTYKNTDFPIVPHFSYEEAKEMAESGLISIQSHSYDMHQYVPYETNNHPVRESVLKFEKEKEKEYIKIFCDDYGFIKSEIESAVGISPIAYSYPAGQSDILNDALLRQMGINITLTSNEGDNIIIKGLPQSLFSLNRYNITDSMTPDELLELIGK